MGEKSLPSHQSKKPKKNLKEKRDAKRLKRDLQARNQKAWTQDR